jgi:hypothetical protein
MEQSKDKSQEISELRGKLNTIQADIGKKLEQIQEAKSRINIGYRHRDRDKYEAERREIAKDLLYYGIEMDRIKAIIKGLEA